MAEYEHRMTISAPPDVVFDFVADVCNLPKYLPTTKAAQPQAGDRVRVQGGGHDFSYDSDGYLRADRANYRLEWGADERYYSGFLQITPQGSESDVTVHISLHGTPSGKPPSDADIREGLVTALNSIQNYVTGQGGKEEHPVAR
jgi:uncharacterized protein YndB with AHSA1/START domain